MNIHMDTHMGTRMNIHMDTHTWGDTRIWTYTYTHAHRDGDVDEDYPADENVYTCMYRRW